MNLPTNILCWKFLIYAITLSSCSAFLSRKPSVISVPSSSIRIAPSKCIIRHIYYCNGKKNSSWKYLQTGSDNRNFPPQSLYDSTRMYLSFDVSPSGKTFSSAIATLITSSVVGLTADRIQLFQGRAGNIITLMMASLLSSIGFAPSSHKVYDICWTRILPASLALMLLPPSNDPPPSEFLLQENHTDSDHANHTYNANCKRDSYVVERNIITAVSIPFILGSIGSILGCMFAALLLSSPSLFLTLQNRFRMSIPEVALAAGCLCSSYIGGTVNFFSTARILSHKLGTFHGYQTHDTLLTSMATADLIIMALYFGWLSAAMSSHTLRRLFPGNPILERSCVVSRREEHATMDRNRNKNRTSQVIPTAHSPPPSILTLQPIATVLFAALLSYGIVEASLIMENIVLIPGLSCAMIALFALLTRRSLRYLSHATGSHVQTDKIRKGLHFLTANLGSVVGPMSSLCFSLLFASIGVSANIRNAICQGPTCILFAFIALVIHLVVILMGSWIINQMGRMNRKCNKDSMSRNKNTDNRQSYIPLSLEEIMIASNALIGGPATAGAFAGRSELGPMDGYSNEVLSRYSDTVKRGLLMSGTIWGVIGYAIGTTVGVTLGSWLLSCQLPFPSR